MIEHLTQTERLALCPVSPFVTIREDEESEAVTLSTPPNGFRMPSMRAVREHDARLAARDSYAPPAPLNDDGDDDLIIIEDGTPAIRARRESSLYDEAFEDELCERGADSLAFERENDNSTVLPSRRGFAAAWREAVLCGFSID